jgi:glycosyltransferase involved in cell wall biosynthesis
LNICFVSQEYPPTDFGGIGRFTNDLATGMAALGHEVHVVTRSPDARRVDFEDGVWLHRLPLPQPRVPELDWVPLAGNLVHSAAVWHEVCRIHAAAPLDVVSAPLWACEGMTCSLDGRFPVVLSLMTSMKTMAAMHPSWGGGEVIRQVIALEGITVRRAGALHAISHAILEKIRDDAAAHAVPAEVVPLGVRDRTGDYPPRRRDDGKVRVLCVGRLERRKGIDVLLDAAAALLPRHPELEFVLAGKETTITETGTTYRAAFTERHAADPSLLGRVTFAGAVSEERLYELYAGADIVCMPSRYESFGLVLVEGMMFGKPVVGCAVGGMVEIVEPGGNGLLAVPGDAASLADCLGRLVESAELRRAFGRRSRELYERKYALPAVVENTLRYYREVAERHRAAPPTEAGMAARLAEVIAEAAGISPERAAGAAARLLGPPCEEVAAPEAPAASSVEGGSPMSSEPAPARRGRLGRLRALLSPGKAVRYVKRLLLLPWNFQKSWDAAQAFQQDVPKLFQDVQRDLLGARGDILRLQGELEQLRHNVALDLERHEKALTVRAEEVTKDMRQLKYRFAEFYGALLEEVRRQGERLERLAAALPGADGQRGQGRAA